MFLLNPVISDNCSAVPVTRIRSPCQIAIFLGVLRLGFSVHIDLPSFWTSATISLSSYQDSDLVNSAIRFIAAFLSTLIPPIYEFPFLNSLCANRLPF